MAHLQIFLSAVSDEFRDYRDLLRRDLDRPDVTVKIQEHFIPTGSETLDKLDEYVRGCDAVIHLVGDMTGARAEPPSVALLRDRYPDLATRLAPLAPLLAGPDPGLSYTQWEAWLALYHRKRLLIAVPGPGAARDPRYVLDPAQRAAQQAHLARLEAVERFPEVTFANPDRLAVELLRSSLQDLLGRRQPTAADDEPTADSVARYGGAVLASFRLDGSGLAVDGASGHALGLAHAFTGTRYDVLGESLDLEQLAGSRARIALLGGPGTGKSVTVKRLLAIAAAQGRVPAFLRLAEFAAALPEGREPSAATLVEALAADATRLGVAELGPPQFRALLAAGRLTIGFDGFDEVAGRARREQIARAIGELGDAAPRVRLVVAARPHEFHATPLPSPTVDGVDRFVVADALPLDGDQARRFLQQCLDDDGSVWTAIQRNPDLRDLARTPLLLTLLGLLGRRGELPVGGPAIYDAVVTTAIEHWEAGKGAVDHSARTVLEDLALAMHQRETPSAPIPLAEARRLGGDEATLDWLVRRTGLVSRAEQAGATSTRVVLQLVHLQVQEYLAGCGLARRLLDPGGTGAALLDRWEFESTWAEPQRFAAARLATLEEYPALEHWVERRVLATPTDADAAFLTAALLASSDADFLPAPGLTEGLVAELARHTGRHRLRDRVGALVALAPRPAALAAVREIALGTPAGRAWLDDLEPWPGASPGADLEAAVAACCRVVARFGPDDDRRRVADWVVAVAPALTELAEWASLAPAVAEAHGPAAARALLTSLATAEPWLLASSEAAVVALLDAVEAFGSAELATELAVQGARRPAQYRTTAGFVRWLDARRLADDVVDDYDDRLRVLVERSDGDRTLGYEGFPLWPERDRPAADALRQAVLRQRDLAWFVRREAFADPRHRNDADRAWLAIVLDEPERSRRAGVVHDLLEHGDVDRAGRLLLEALGSELVARWWGTTIVTRLAAVGLGPRVRGRLEELVAGAATDPTLRELARGLLAEHLAATT